jgi:DNA-binding Lrp family transcriptional regulator
LSLISQGLSAIDKKILKILLAPNGEAGVHVAASASSDRMIAAELGLPPDTITKRRRRLEGEFLQLLYVMNLVNLGYRRVDFLIATQRGLTIALANDLLKIKEVVRVGRSVGQPTIDLRAEILIRNNGELLELLEFVKAMDGVRDVVWSEIVQVVGDKGSVPMDVIDLL